MGRPVTTVLVCLACVGGCGRGGDADRPDRRPAVPAINTPAVTGPSFTFGQFRGTSRVLALLTPAADHPTFVAQSDLIGGRDAGFVDRDIVRIDVVGHTAAADGISLPPGTAEAVRRQLNVPEPQFALVLIGKDGTEKIRTHKPLPVDKLYATIDAMPMRQREVAQRREQSKAKAANDDTDANR